MALIEVIQKAIDYIEEKLCDDFGLEDIAKHTGVSAFDFRRIFPMICGISIGEYIRNRRLSLSAQELLSGKSSILDIALKYGYSTPEGYTRAFYRYYGITPSAVRCQRLELDLFHKISVEQIFKGVNRMKKLKERGYSVKSIHQYYHTMDMDKTVKWFTDILGWYAAVETRDEHNNGIYGSAGPYPGELIELELLPFNGIMFVGGEPVQGVVGFINVKGIDGFYNHVTEKGWTEITKPEKQFWGGTICIVTTIDGSKYIFSEHEE